MAKRINPDYKVSQKSTDYFGSAHFTKTSPDLTSKNVKSLNLDIPFDEALKLYVAIQGCVQSLNRYNRGTKKGKSMGLSLSIKMDIKSIAVIEAKVAKKPD